MMRLFKAPRHYRWTWVCIVFTVGLILDGKALLSVLPMIGGVVFYCIERNFKVRKEDQILSIDDIKRELLRRGAHFASYSAFDKKAIGYDAERQTLIIAYHDQRKARFVEYGIADIRNVSWSIPGADTVELYGNVDLGTKLRTQARNRAALYEAKAAAGLRINLADINRPVATVNLDASEQKMKRWHEIMQQAFEGRLKVPATPVHV